MTNDMLILQIAPAARFMPSVSLVRIRIIAEFLAGGMIVVLVLLLRRRNIQAKGLEQQLSKVVAEKTRTIESQKIHVQEASRAKVNSSQT